MALIGMFIIVFALFSNQYNESSRKMIRNELPWPLRHYRRVMEMPVCWEEILHNHYFVKLQPQ